MAASKLRYATMRKVDFSDWSDISRFATYARNHLGIAKTASSQLEYWETLYDLLTRGKLSHSPQQALSPPQVEELSNLQKQIAQLPSHERYSLAKSIEYRHRTTLGILRKMAQGGLLDPNDFTRHPSISQSGNQRPAARQHWAVAYDRNNRPVVEGGRLKLYLTKSPSFGENLRRALDEAARLKTECGTPARLGFFLGYMGRSTLNQLLNRTYQNSLTPTEARHIEATNEMIEFIQNEWKINQPSTMKSSQPKNQAQDKTPTSITANQPSLAPSPAPVAGPSIVNHITIQGAMNGDIGFQHNKSPASEQKSFPNSYSPSVARTHNTPHQKSPTRHPEP